MNTNLLSDEERDKLLLNMAEAMSNLGEAIQSLSHAMEIVIDRVSIPNYQGKA